ncbi:MAG: DUF4162 domain-containing protein, partial [Candidatus Kapaibacteriota bacterium]
NKGKVVLCGSLSDIKASREKDTVICEYTSNGNNFLELKNVKILNQTQNRIEFRFDKNNFNLKEFIKEITDKVDIKKIEISSPGLREIFIEEVTKVQ